MSHAAPSLVTRAFALRLHSAMKTSRWGENSSVFMFHSEQSIWHHVTVIQSTVAANVFIQAAYNVSVCYSEYKSEDFYRDKQKNHVNTFCSSVSLPQVQ